MIVAKILSNLDKISVFTQGFDMKILVATGNKDKLNEIREFFKNDEIYGLGEVLEPFEIIEDGKSFKENALIKVCAVYERLLARNLHREYLVMSDDSGICVDILGGAPGIYSARFSGEGATDASNRAKLASELIARGVRSSGAHYVAAIALKSHFGEYCTHGFMHGEVICEERGENGFGYDFMFIPRRYEELGEGDLGKTIGELPAQIKGEISHRSRGLALMKILINSFKII